MLAIYSLHVKTESHLEWQRIIGNRGSFDAVLRFPIFLERRDTTADVEGARLFHVSSAVRVL